MQFFKHSVLLSLLSALLLAGSAYALPEAVRLDMLKTKLAEQLKNDRYQDAVQTFEELATITSFQWTPTMTYFNAKALFESGNKVSAYSLFESYVEQTGQTGKYYQQALAYMLKAEPAYLAVKEAGIKRLEYLNSEEFLQKRISTIMDDIQMSGNRNVESKDGDYWVNFTPFRYVVHEGQSWMTARNITFHHTWRHHVKLYKTKKNIFTGKTKKIYTGKVNIRFEEREDEIWCTLSNIKSVSLRETEWYAEDGYYQLKHHVAPETGGKYAWQSYGVDAKSYLLLELREPVKQKLTSYTRTKKENGAVKYRTLDMIGMPVGDDVADLEQKVAELNELLPRLHKFWSQPRKLNQ